MGSKFPWRVGRGVGTASPECPWLRDPTAGVGVKHGGLPVCREGCGQGRAVPP